MAIIIPSKNIYGDIENPKVRNNLINKVNIDHKLLKATAETDVNVDTFKTWYFNDDGGVIPTLKQGYDDTTNTLNKYYVANATAVRVMVYHSTFNIRVQKQKSISSVITNLDDSDIPFSISLKKTAKPYRTLYNPSTNEFNFSQGETVGEISTERSSNYSYTFDQTDANINTQSKVDIRKFYCNVTDKNITAKINTSFFELGDGGGAITNDTEVNVSLTDFNVEFTEADDWYNVKISDFPSKIEAILAYSSPRQNISEGDKWVSKDYLSYGYKIELSPISVEFIFNGNVLGVSLEDTNVTYGNGFYPYAINGNELMQNSAPSLNALANKIIEEYSQGKETVTLRCDIGEYYLYDSTKPTKQSDKVISTTDSGLNMIFTEGDIVIPMIPSAMGGDEPMSRYKDGSPKEFRVVGTSIINDGAIWQKIYLQELYKKID